MEPREPRELLMVVSTTIDDDEDEDTVRDRAAEKLGPDYTVWAAAS